MDKQYLINKLHEFYNTHGWVPDQRDLRYTFDYPNPKQYIKEFGSWANVLGAAGFDPEISQYTYTSEELAGALWDYYYTYGKYPSSVDIDNNPNYPSATTFTDRFGSWDNALEYAGMPIPVHLYDKPDVCEFCGITETYQWHNYNDYKVCSNCYQTLSTQYVNGILDPNCNNGIAVVTEYITSCVINDCQKCNIFGNFHHPYDLISKSLGTINVKSSLSNKRNLWRFAKRENQTIPDYYICIGFNEDRTEIVKVFQIPGNSDLVKSYGIAITNTKRGLKKALQYEIDSNPYNEIYQNLDIYTLPEFSNYNNDN